MTDVKLSHLDDKGAARMVDVSGKAVTKRMSRAQGQITMKPETMALLTSGTAPKGDLIATARIAGIMATKRCHDLIPLCHPLPISKVTIDFDVDTDANTVTVECEVVVSGKTGVEMEALTGASVACLTLYDMLKAVDRGMVISDIKVLEKLGGKSGHYMADD